MIDLLTRATRILDTVQVVTVIHSNWWYLIENYANTSALAIVPWYARIFPPSASANPLPDAGVSGCALSLPVDPCSTDV